MIINMLKCKLHGATITQCDLHYEGSLSLDPALIEAAGLLPYEQIDVLNITNGARFTTYVIEGEKGSGIVGVNGAAARLAQKGDKVIICAYTQIEKSQAHAHKPVVVLMNDNNTIKEISGSSGRAILKEVQA